MSMFVVGRFAGVTDFVAQIFNEPLLELISLRLSKMLHNVIVLIVVGKGSSLILPVNQSFMTILKRCSLSLLASHKNFGSMSNPLFGDSLGTEGLPMLSRFGFKLTLA